MKTDGAFGGRITPALIQGRSLKVRWLRNRKSLAYFFTSFYGQTEKHLYLLRDVRALTYGPRPSGESLRTRSEV
jgi:hypothetical protein